MFHVGQKVVCIRQTRLTGRHGFGHETLPVKGEVYTIREVVPPDDSIERPACLRLEEIVNEPANYVSGVIEFSFKAHHFRPVKTTNIDVFLKLLEPLDEHVQA